MIKQKAVKGAIPPVAPALTIGGQSYIQAKPSKFPTTDKTERTITISANFIIIGRDHLGGSM